MGVFRPEIGSLSFALLCGEENITIFVLMKNFAVVELELPPSRSFSTWIPLGLYRPILSTFTHWWYNFPQNASFMFVFPSVSREATWEASPKLDCLLRDCKVLCSLVVRYFLNFSFLVGWIPSCRMYSYFCICSAWRRSSLSTSCFGRWHGLFDLL